MQNASAMATAEVRGKRTRQNRKAARIITGMDLAPGGAAVRVPFNVLYSFFRHAPDISTVKDLYRPERDEDDDITFSRVNPDALKGYRFSLDGYQIELLLAAYFQADPRTGIARFPSFFNWGSLAAGGSSAKPYTNTIKIDGESPDATARRKNKKAINEIHRLWLDFYDRKTKFSSLVETPPVTIHVCREGATERIQWIDVEISPYLRHRLTEAGKMQHYAKIPMNFRQLLKSGGIKRVETPHILLYLYLFTRLANERFTISLETICRKIGIAHYLDSRHADRAQYLIASAVHALVRQSVLLPETCYRSGDFHINLNPFYFKNIGGRN